MTQQNKINNTGDFKLFFVLHVEFSNMRSVALRFVGMIATLLGLGFKFWHWYQGRGL